MYRSIGLQLEKVLSGIPTIVEVQDPENLEVMYVSKQTDYLTTKESQQLGIV